MPLENFILFAFTVSQIDFRVLCEIRNKLFIVFHLDTSCLGLIHWVDCFFAYWPAVLLVMNQVSWYACFLSERLYVCAIGHLVCPCSTITCLHYRQYSIMMVSDFLTLQWCKSDMHSLEIVLWILTWSLPWLVICSMILLCDAGQRQWATVRNQPCNHEGK